MFNINHLTEGSLNLLARDRQPGHIINHFRLERPFEVKSNFQGFSIRYVAAGTEFYQIGNREYRVRSGQYLLTHPAVGHADSMAEGAVSGLCIDLMPDLIANAFAALRRPGDPLPDPVEGEPLFTDFMFSAAESKLGNLLGELDRWFRREEPSTGTFDPALFFQLAELYAADSFMTRDRLMAIPAVKDSTRKDMLRRLVQGRNFIDDCFRTDIQVADVARAANVSEFHFFRLFRRVFGTTPHRYLWEKRLCFGRRLLEGGRHSVSEAALEAGFADVQSFSKAYKKFYGCPPSDCLRISRF